MNETIDNINNKQKYFEDIKKINSINISYICKKLNINIQNLYNLKTSSKKIKLVKDELIYELKKCINEMEDKNV